MWYKWLRANNIKKKSLKQIIRCYFSYYHSTGCTCNYQQNHINILKNQIVKLISYPCTLILKFRISPPVALCRIFFEREVATTKNSTLIHVSILIYSNFNHLYVITLYRKQGQEQPDGSPHAYSQGVYRVEHFNG